jgi:hypothetical protein
VPRPPQPIKPRRIVSLPTAYALRATGRTAAEAARNCRREGFAELFTKCSIGDSLSKVKRLDSRNGSLRVGYRNLANFWFHAILGSSRGRRARLAQAPGRHARDAEFLARRDGISLASTPFCLLQLVRRAAHSMALLIKRWKPGSCIVSALWPNWMYNTRAGDGGPM